MVPERTSVQDYLQRLVDDCEELRFLNSVPWIVGTHRQDQVHVLAGLRDEASWFAEIEDPPLFSLITPLWNTPPRLLNELILSVRCQSWLRWELILVDDGSTQRDHLDVARAWAARDDRIQFSTLPENRGISTARNEAIARSSGDFVAILDHDDLLHPQALGTFVRHLHGTPDANFLYSNEAKINEASDRVSFYFSKPPFDLATLLRVNSIVHFTAIRRDLLLSAQRDGLIFRPQHDGAEDHDLFIRIAMTGRMRPIHVPMCLYYWRMIPTSAAMSLETKPNLDLKRKAMLDELLPEIYPGAKWVIRPPDPELGNLHTSIRITALEARPTPRLLVMVPFKDHLELTLRCLESLEVQQHELNIKVILINNRSCDPATIPGLARWLECPRRNRFEVVDHDGAFNYARIHNRVIERHGEDQDLLLFLNNDVELISPDCLQTLAMHLLADEACGFAGIRLNFPDGGGIQHGGFKIHDSALTSGCYLVHHATELTDYVSEERVAFGVVFACAMVRRETFERLGGLEEVLLPNSYGDIDLLARALKLGFRNFYYGTLTGTHHESKSRNRASEECEYLALHIRHAQVITDWKLRGYTLSLQSWTLPVIPPPPSEVVPLPPPEPIVEVVLAPASPPPPIPPALPLRYKIADLANFTLKLALGPLHSALKAGMLGTWHRLRANRAPAIAAARNRPKPHFRPEAEGAVARARGSSLPGMSQRPWKHNDVLDMMKRCRQRARIRIQLRVPGINLRRSDMKFFAEGEWLGKVGVPTGLSAEEVLSWVAEERSACKMAPGEAVDILFAFLFEGTAYERRRVYASLMELATPDTILETALRAYRLQGYEGYLSEAASLLADFKAAAWPTIRRWAHLGEECELLVDVIITIEGVANNERRDALLDIAQNGDENARRRVLESIHTLPDPARREVLQALRGSNGPPDPVQTEAEERLAEYEV